MGFTLSEEQRKVIASSSARLQVTACAGSGKTETMARRIARLVADGAPPASIVAFTFTQRAAASLKNRVLERCAEALGEEAIRGLGRLFVGTIHAFCLRLLQEHAPQYAGYDLLDDHRLAALLSREFKRLSLGEIGESHWRTIRDFLRNADAVENEMIPASKLKDPFARCYAQFGATLDAYHFLTYGRVITKAVEVLGDAATAAAARDELRHLIVDEYQDVNPAQERLIELLAAGPVNLCVVGDDDQAIYQWRGSDVGNIQSFARRRGRAEVRPLSVNRRSTPEIITAANGFVSSVRPRLPKQMHPARPGLSFPPFCWSAETPPEEAEVIADHIAKLRGAGYRCRDIAVLYRAVRTSAQPLLAALGTRGIPFNCAGRTGLFLQPEAALFGRTYAWLSGSSWEWQEDRSGEPEPLEPLLADYSRCFQLGRGSAVRLREHLRRWHDDAQDDRRKASLVGDYYHLLHLLGVAGWNLDDTAVAARAGTLARFSRLLADFEHAKRRARPVEENGIHVHRGGAGGGLWFYKNLFNYMRFYAFEAYEDFAGEDNPAVDAVDVLTVHQAKGLEWPVVFIPSLTAQRFPSSMAGRAQHWLLPEAAFPESARRRYEGGETDERRLFYVALTRARDALYLSAFRRMRNRARPSPFLTEVAAGSLHAAPLPMPPAGTAGKEEPVRMVLSFSDLAAYGTCAFSYRLRSLLGFEPQFAEELGYGRAVHGILRRLAELARATGKAPAGEEADKIIEEEFYLPFANRSLHENMRQAARKLVGQYLAKYGADLLRTWDTERPFELRIAGGTIQGRADVILDREGGTPSALALADYKTSPGAGESDLHAFQLAIYAAAARDEGLDVRAAYLHELGPKAAVRRDIAIGEREIQAAVNRAAELAAGIAQRRFPPCRAEDRAETCSRCDVRLVCGHAPGEGTGRAAG